jgi:pyrrolidone-carboxylate peptidase
MRIVVTGFGPFGGYSTNPSTVVVNKLGDKFSSDLQIELITKTLDVDYLEALECSKWICEELKADVIKVTSFLHDKIEISVCDPCWCSADPREIVVGNMFLQRWLYMPGCARYL